MMRLTLPHPILSVEKATERMMAIMHTSITPGKERHISAGMGGLPDYDVEHSARLVDQGVRCAYLRMLFCLVTGCQLQDAWLARHTQMVPQPVAALQPLGTARWMRGWVKHSLPRTNEKCAVVLRAQCCKRAG